MAIGQTDEEAQQNYDDGRVTSGGCISGPQVPNIGFDFRRDTHAKSILIVVAYAAPDGTQTKPLECAQQGFQNCSILRRDISYDEQSSMAIDVTIDPRCIGKAYGAGTTCEHGDCLSDICDYGFSCQLLASQPSYPWLADPCPDAAADAKADASCGVGFCTAVPPDLSCQCSGGTLGVGVNCRIGDPPTEGTYGGVTGYRCFCDLNLFDSGVH